MEDEGYLHYKKLTANLQTSQCKLDCRKFIVKFEEKKAPHFRGA